MPEKKVLVLGLDCAAPQLVFDRWAHELPAISQLMQRGIYGPLKSCIPPITIPAWLCMMTGKDPGQLGCYGFRNRADYSYQGLSFATAKMVREDTLWDILSRQRKQVLLVGIPQTYPPKPVSGLMVSCFLTPDTSCQYTYPAGLKDEIKAVVGDYILDVDHFRTDDKALLLQQVYAMTEQRFTLFRHFLATRAWDFAMMVDMGMDRIHHGFWKYIDPAHPRYQPGSPYEKAVLEYYKFVDRKISDVISCIDPAAAVLIVSDHGAQAMQGGICINEWLIRQGYLHVAEKPDGVVPLHRVRIDWSRTKAWGEGGYYSRIFLNVQGREPQGTIPAHAYEGVRDELAQKLEALTDERGRNIGTRVFKPEEVYRQIQGIPPDLIVYPGNLSWRSVGSIGLNRIHTFENDTGPDDANHAEQGIFILYDPAAAEHASSSRLRTDLSLTDVAPTVLGLLGVAVPQDMEGKRLSSSTDEQSSGEHVYSQQQQEDIKKRLEDLGYL
jgi:predicted AlkP superfamily phosphohydrolase/phosphomutase